MTNQALGSQSEVSGSVNSGVVAQKGMDAQEAAMHGAVTTKNYEESDDEQQLRQGQNGRDQDIGIGGNGKPGDG